MLSTHYLPEPPDDFELQGARDPLAYRIAIPSGGIGPNTGLVFYIHGYGFAFDDAYADKLLRRLADGFDLVAVAVRYFGATVHKPTGYALSASFFAAVAEKHGIRATAPAGTPPDIVLKALLQALAQRGVTELDKDCLLTVTGVEYHSFGLLPALDHMAVLHAVLAGHQLDKRRLFVLGSSYGGYIASLLVKLAPHSFRMVVDNSGFSSPRDDLSGTYGYTSVEICGVKVPASTQRHFTRDFRSPAWFSPARLRIRDLLERDHITPTSTQIFGYHSVADRVAPIELKRRLAQVYAGRVPFVQAVIDRKGLDGRLFKTLEHGMRASLSGLFAHSYDSFAAAAAEAVTDFDLGTRLAFDCGTASYRVEYSRTGLRAGADCGLRSG